MLHKIFGIDLTPVKEGYHSLRLRPNVEERLSQAII